MGRTTHTYAIAPVSKATFDEVAKVLKDAGYDHAFDTREGTIDMHGIALQVQNDGPAVQEPARCDCTTLAEGCSMEPPSSPIGRWHCQRCNTSWDTRPEHCKIGGHMLTVPFDECLAKLKPGEPFFVLLGRDPEAPEAIYTWIESRRHREGISARTESAAGKRQEFLEYRRAMYEVKETAAVMDEIAMRLKKSDPDIHMTPVAPISTPSADDKIKLEEDAERLYMLFGVQKYAWISLDPPVRRWWVDRAQIFRKLCG